MISITAKKGKLDELCHNLKNLEVEKTSLEEQKLQFQAQLAFASGSSLDVEYNSM